MIILLVLVAIVGGFVMYREIKKKNKQVAPLILESPMTPAQIGQLTGTRYGGFDKNNVTRQLQSAGFSDIQIQDFYDYLDTGAKSSRDVYMYLYNMV